METKQKRGVKALERHEAKPVDGQPVQPKDLDKNERAAWSRIVESLSRQGSLSETDSHLLELYARTYVMWHKASNDLKTQPYTYDGPGGRAFVNPLISVVNNTGASLKSLLRELTLTVKSRSSQPVENSGLGEFEELL